jgi:hypothetical protein
VEAAQREAIRHSVSRMRTLELLARSLLDQHARLSERVAALERQVGTRQWKHPGARRKSGA